MEFHSRIAPIIAPRRSGPTFETTSTNLPEPAINPINGAPVKGVANVISKTAIIMAGTKPAIIALPRPPDFLPPTNPAISGPMKGSQNRSTVSITISTERRNRSHLKLVIKYFLLSSDNLLF